MKKLYEVIDLTPERIAALRKLAEAAKKNDESAWEKFSLAVSNPYTILALLDHIAALEALCEEAYYVLNGIPVSVFPSNNGQERVDMWHSRYKALGISPADKPAIEIRGDFGGRIEGMTIEKGD